MRRVVSSILAGVLLLVFPTPGPSQTTDIRGAAIALLPTTVEIERVTIENRRSSPLIAWELRWPSVGGGQSFQRSDFSWQPFPLSRGNGPIQPNEQRTIETPPRTSSDLGPVALRFAAFADGYLEGEPDAVEGWVRERRDHLEDAGYWVRAFEAMPRDSEERAKTYLAARVAERAADVSTDSSGTRGQLARLWQTPAPAGSVYSIVRRIQQDAERQLAVLTRLLSPARTTDSTPAVVLASERITITDYKATITNLRNVPIEAFGFDIVDAGSHRPLGGRMTDFCLSEPASSAWRVSGRIAPGESQDSHLGLHIEDPSNLPVLKLTFVLYDDLSFEGSARSRDELLRQREELADDLAFASALRMELSKLPPDDVRRVLVTRRAERMKQLLLQGRPPQQRMLDEMFEQAKRSPQQLQDMTVEANAAVDRQRERLLRHRR